jgi:transglutaminase-like putative cysteine protease
MLVALLGLLTALVNAHMPAGRPPLLLAAQTAGRMALLGAPIMAALFLLFPRLSPLWGIPADGMSGRSGLSGTMQVGTVARLALDDSIALRVRFEGTPPRQADLYFRGPVLSTFDGRDWLPLRSEFPARMRPPANLQVRGEPVRYRVTMEPSNRPWVLVLDAAAMRPALPGYELSLGADLQWQADRPITDLVRYEARSHTEFRHGPPGPVVGLQDYVRLPAGFNPRTLQWAADLRRDPRYANADGARLVDLAMDHLRNSGYAYTLEPGTYGRDSADEFWFDRKQGFCEHIASSFVVLMRALDIPARIVTGYQGGELNAVDGFHVVRQSDAHAWAEVWLPERGWVRVDPTSAVAPGRIGSLERLQAPRGLIASGLVTMSPEMALSLRALWDAVNNRWNQWILNYTQDRQMNLLKDLGFEAPDWQTASYLLIGLVVVVSLGAAAWTMWEVRRQDPWLRLLQRAGRRLAGVGLAVPPHSSARNMAELVRQHLSRDDRNTQALQEWLRRMEVWRYGPPASQGTTLQALQREFRQLPWPK